MGGITVDDFTSSVAYREIFGLGEQEGEQKGRQTEAAAITVRLLEHRCGTLSPSQQSCIQALPLSRARSSSRRPARLPGAQPPHGLAEPARRLRAAPEPEPLPLQRPHRS